MALRVLVIALMSLHSNRASADEIAIDFLMSREPAEKLQLPIEVFSPELLPLWRKALTHSESELQRQAAEAIARAHQKGFAGMSDAGLDLRAVFVSPKSHPATRYAAAYALIALDQREFASTLFEISQQQGKDLHQLIEPALARWNFEPIRDVWHHRIANISTPRRDMILAINGVGEEHDDAAIDDLLNLSIPVSQPADVRLAAARAVGRIASNGLEQSAEHLLARRPSSILDRLCAVAIIERHKSNEAVTLLQKLGTDEEPAVAAAALRGLFGIDPQLVLPLWERSLAHPDANVRRVAIQTFAALPTAERVMIVAHSLNDPHPELRILVRNLLFKLSKQPTLDSAIRESSTQVLNGDGWRGQEQAALLLAALDQKSVASRLVQLLDSPRPEVKVTAAWALKTIAVPYSLAAILEFARSSDQASTSESKPNDHQMAHLFELMGRLNFVEAIPLLESYVPKSLKRGESSRAAAIWALGLIFEGQPNEDLAKNLMDRIRDTRSIPPEHYEVRRTSALTIGRLKGDSQLGGLKEMIGETVDNDGVELALRWAVLQISGEALPIAAVPPYQSVGWFLEPVAQQK